jgi:hypothetical protein
VRDVHKAKLPGVDNDAEGAGVVEALAARELAMARPLRGGKRSGVTMSNHKSETPRPAAEGSQNQNQANHTQPISQDTSRFKRGARCKRFRRFRGFGAPERAGRNGAGRIGTAFGLNSALVIKIDDGLLASDIEFLACSIFGPSLISMWLGRETLLLMYCSEGHCRRRALTDLGQQLRFPRPYSHTLTWVETGRFYVLEGGNYPSVVSCRDALSSDPSPSVHRLRSIMDRCFSSPPPDAINTFFVALRALLECHGCIIRCSGFAAISALFAALADWEA